MKNILKVTILFCLIIISFVVPSFATSGSPYLLPVTSYTYPDVKNDGVPITGGGLQFYFTSSGDYVYVGYLKTGSNNRNLIFGSDKPSMYYYQANNSNLYQSAILSNYDSVNQIYFVKNTINYYNNGNMNPDIGQFDNESDFKIAVRQALDNIPQYNKNPNVDEFIANTIISLGIHYNQYSDALSIASSAWNYIIDDNNWYIGSGDRNDKSIIWDIDSAVSYANAQSNNYIDWYNGYKVNKDLTIALAKFISDNYTASTVGEGTLAGYSVKYNSNYNYGTTSGTSGFDGNFGSSPNALSFYPASTITYFNGAYLHDNDVIDQDEFVYSPADVRKFIGYPSTTGIIEYPDNTPASGIITDGNGDTVYNIDLDFPSLDWLADAIQSVLDFLNNLLTTIADFLTQILDAILSLFSDAFESLTEFGNGLIEWLYSVVSSFSTLGSNYIPASLWSVLLPFIFLNIGVGLIMFVLRSH